MPRGSAPSPAARSRLSTWRPTTITASTCRSRGELRESFYVPGRLFSVNRTTAQLVPGLFSRNERVFCGFDSGGMPWAIILVGALNVGSMATVWHGDVTPRKHREVTALPVNDVLVADRAAQGRGDGALQHGFDGDPVAAARRRRLDWRARQPASTLRMGERIGTLRGWHPGSGSAR